MKPILFSTPMVQALLASRKSQTRRVCGKHLNIYPAVSKHITSGTYDFHFPDGVGQIDEPKYQVGDILYVRETWNYFGSLDPGYLSYKATYPHDLPKGLQNVPPIEDVKWKPSLFMPKEAARIFLEITAVRAERLQDITEEDAIAEGIEMHVPVPGDGLTVYKSYLGPHPYYNPIMSFRSLWDSINAKKHPWDSNPWVWVYTFKKITQP